MDAESTIRAYYEALRSGESLPPFFAPDDSTVKFGIGERLAGYDEIRAGLSEQTETTADWEINSRHLLVTQRTDHAWFLDDVFMAWTNLEREVRYEFDTRWSGTLERRSEGTDRTAIETPWRFVGMHVSTPGGTR